MERNANSVLAKLMGIERPSLTTKSPGRFRVLSESYLQNIALVSHRERSSLGTYEDKDEFSIAAESHLDKEDIVQLSRGNSNVKTKSEVIRSPPQDQRSQQFKRFNWRGNSSSSSGLGHLSHLGSSHSSSVQKQESGKAWIWQAKSLDNAETGCFRYYDPNDCYAMKNDYLSPFKSIVEQNTQNGKENTSSSLRNKGKSFQGRKRKTFYNDIESKMKDLVPPQEIAKQVTSQLKQSIWHSFADVSELGPRSDKSFANEHGEMMSTSSCLSSLENGNENPSFEPIKKRASQETPKIKKELSERWTVRKSPQEANSFSGNINGWRTSGARYLSKPMLFPSAWVPRSRTRDLNLDRNWCLKPENNLLQFDIQKEALAIWNHSEILEESSVLEEISSALDTFSEKSVISDVESPTYHEALVFPSDTSDKYLENHFGEIVDMGNEKMATCIKLQRKQFSAEATACILSEDRGSSFSEFCLKHQEKENSAEPVSPVSSLEGPEACGCRPNSIVESYQFSSASDCLNKNIHGMQTKLGIADTVSLESGSEGFEMLVSSDGDNEGDYIGCYREDAQIMELYRTSENRDFSYVVDVLSELGFPTLNMEIECEAWQSQGYALNPLVFDSIEKKYGKQTYWEKSERKLLFDCMNVGLMEIARSLDPINAQCKPLAKRFGSTRNQELIEEELWALLVKQEEESKRKSSSKVCGRETEWLGLEAYTYSIVKEVESLLLDELVEAFVTMA